MYYSLILLFLHQESHLFMRFLLLFARKIVPLQREVHEGTAKVIKMIKLMLLSLLIIAIAMALFSVKLIFKKNGKFSSQHVHDNPGLRKMGIHCVVDQDREAREANKAY